MKAYQCDRCGAFFTDDDFKEDWVIKHPRDTEPGFDYIMTGAPNRQCVVIDLCPRCTKTINNWLNDGGASHEILSIPINNLL